MSFFERVALAPPDLIFGLVNAYLADPRGNKVNLGVGYYRNEMLKTPIMECVKQAEKVLWESESNKEYLSIDGHKALIEKVGELVFGEKYWEKEHTRIAGFQTVGGTGALKVAGTFFKEECDHPLFIPSPTWPNHFGVLLGCRLHIESYPYYDMQTHSLDFEKMCAFLEKRAPKSIILFHASCHNPTGRDPDLEQWRAIAEIVLRKKLIPFFDCAYQGLGEGVNEDAKAVRLFAEEGCEMLVCFSAAKNFSMYGERVGVLFIVTEGARIKEHVTSRVKQFIRTNYSNPPRHGGAVVAHILCDLSLKDMWLEELKSMRHRIDVTKKEFADKLIAQCKAVDFRHLKGGHGMFCFTGLNETTVERLQTEYGIYMPRDGRINLCGLNRNNIDYVVNNIVNIA